MVSRRGWGRRRKIALLAGVCVAALAIVAWLNRPRDEPVKSTVGDAVRTFRAKDKGAKENGGGRREPALGVYRYATRGSESVKVGILGTTHDYYGTSTISLSEGPCGQRERWQVLAGRWSEAEACHPEHDRVASTITEFHEFFETGQRDTFRCHTVFPRPLAELRKGDRFSTLCSSSDSTIATHSTVAGIEPVTVGGETFDAVRTDSDSVLEGATTGSARRQEWRRRDDGLLLRRAVESEADTGDAGGSHYTERYTLRLLSTEPRR